MATRYHNLSDYDPSTVPSGEGLRFAIVVSQWNDKVTHALLDGAAQTLCEHGVNADDIDVTFVPGSFELIYGCATAVGSGKYDAVIAIGCVVRGDTPHFDYICQGVTQGIAELNTRGTTPVVYTLLTCNTMQQAFDRCGGEMGNKGVEGAVTALHMTALAR